MSIYQPAKTTIYGKDFDDKAYSFVVESSLGSEVISPDILVIKTTAGYKLATSLTDKAELEQRFTYRKQPDNSWVAGGTVTLLLSEEFPIDGTVTIQNLLAEKVILTISANPTTSASLERVQALTVSHSALTFAPTSPGKPSFLILTVAQPHSDAPVTLTTDAPDYFQLASDKHPNFASSLTLTPSPIGTYIHVRYRARKGGLHAGQLLIDSIYETRMIELTGRSASLLPIVRSSSRHPILMRQWAGVFCLLVLGELAYVSYTNRCQLFPSLCQNTTTSPPTNNLSLPERAHGNDTDIAKNVAERKRTQQTITKVTGSTIQKSLRSELTKNLAKQPKSEIVEEQQQNTGESGNVNRTISGRKNLAEPDLDKAVYKRARRRTTTPPTAEESELEKALNQPVPKQL